MSYFNAIATRRHIAFAESEALRDRMLEQYCGLIEGAEMETSTAKQKPPSPAPADWEAARRKIARMMGGR